MAPIYREQYPIMVAFQRRMLPRHAPADWTTPRRERALHLRASAVTERVGAEHPPYGYGCEAPCLPHSIAPGGCKHPPYENIRPRHAVLTNRPVRPANGGVQFGHSRLRVIVRAGRPHKT